MKSECGSLSITWIKNDIQTSVSHITIGKIKCRKAAGLHYFTWERHDCIIIQDIINQLYKTKECIWLYLWPPLQNSFIIICWRKTWLHVYNNFFVELTGELILHCDVRADTAGHQLCSSEAILFTTGWYSVCMNLLAVSDPGCPSHSSYKPLTTGLSKGPATFTCNI